MYQDDNFTVIIEDLDLCFTCANRQDCPYMQALYDGIVEMMLSAIVTDCKFYRPVGGHLKVVKDV